MDIKRHFCVYKRDFEVYKIIKMTDIKYKESDDTLVIDMLESDKDWPIVKALIDRRLISTPLTDLVFSKEELDNAPWMTVRSKWRCGYPQPEAAYKYEDNITYTKESHCSKCDAGLKQIGPFRIKKIPNWSGKRQFMELNWIWDELFLSEKAKNILEDSDITGISFLEVKNKSGKETVPGIYQLIIPHILDKGFLPEKVILRNYTVCPECHTEKFCTVRSKLAFKKEIFDNAPDAVKTAEIFSANLAAPRKNIISNKFYRVLVDNGIDRELCFEPIDLF